MKTKKKQNGQQRSTSKSKEKEKILENIYLSPLRLKKEPDSKKSNEDIHNGHKRKSESPVIQIRKVQSKQGNRDEKRKLNAEKSSEKYASIRTTSKSKEKFYVNEKKIPSKEDELNNKVQECYEFMKKGHLKTAEKHLTKLHHSNHYHEDIFLYLGMIQEAKQKTKDAKFYYEKYIEKAKKINKKSYTQFLNLAKCEEFIGDNDSALKNCNFSLQLSETVEGLHLKGVLLIKLKKYGPAMDAFSKALKINSSNPKLYEGLGDCYKGSQAYEMALQQYSQSSKIDSDQNIRVIQKQLECYEKMKDGIKVKETKNLISRIMKEKSNSKREKRRYRKDDSSSSLSSEKKHEMKNVKINFYQKKEEEPSLRKKEISEEEAEREYNQGNFEKALKILNSDLKNNEGSFQQYNLRAQMYFQMQEYDKCQNDIYHALVCFQKQEKSGKNDLLQFNKRKERYKEIKFLMNRLKEINAQSLTQSDDYRILNRRKRCLGQALRAFRQNSEKSERTIKTKLSEIPQQNSLANSSIYFTAQISIFRLKNINHILQNWSKHKFSISSLEKTTDLAFKMVQNNSKDFSILPLHIIYSFFQPENKKKSFKAINEEVSSILSRMCKKYPPSQQNISRSKIKSFDVDWKNQQKVNLFPPQTHFSTFTELHKAIQKLADQAESEKHAMDKIAKELCEKNNGFNFKSCLKIEKDYLNQKMIEERVLCRVVQKILSSDIKKWKNDIFRGVEIKMNKSIEYYFELVNREWENTIDFILQKNKKEGKAIQFYVYDLIRSKCMFKSVTDIVNTCKMFIKFHDRKDIQLIQIDNRLQYKTKDVVLKYRVKNIVGELQLALEFESIQNQFNHGLYQLFRSEFGPFFASIMWFSGFGLRKNRVFFQEKLKWNLRGLQHLRKFIYEDEIYVDFLDHSHMKLMKIQNFDISLNEMYFSVQQKEALFNTISSEERLVMKAIEGSFLDEELMVTIRIENTTDFLTITESGMNVIELENSLAAKKNYQLRIRFSSGKNDKFYEDKMKECLENQKKVVELMKIDD